MTETATHTPLRKRDSHLWARDQHDFYIEPAWCSQRLFEVETFKGKIWDPACGTGRIIDAAIDAGHVTDESDLVDRGRGYRLDFLTSGATVPNIVSNPPFGIAETFVARALELAERKVVMLLPTKWIQGERRARWLAGTSLRRVWFLCPRPSMPPGRAILGGLKPGNGTTDYAWFVWERGWRPQPEIRWLHRDSRGE
jgi:hypothetical protein